MNMDEEIMDRGIRIVGVAFLLSAIAALAACSSTGQSSAYQVASCKGGYPDGAGIMNMSPYSPHADSFQPPCQGK
jgi:hypothetical protein